jgi:predicted porin
MNNNKILPACGLVLAGLAGLASAQQSTQQSTQQSDGVTIYGVVDAAMVYSSNQNGQSNTYMRSGNQASSRLGFKGFEDLGGGTQALYVLEAGFNLDDGTSSTAGSLFNRQAYVGLTNKQAGTLTVGRQYTPYYLFVGPVAQVNYVTGATGAHPGDIDGLDVTIRSSNAMTYMSPVWRGVQLGMSAALGEQTSGKRNGDTFSAAVKYDAGPWNFALGYQALRNGPNGATWDTAASSSFSKSPVNAGYLSADAVHYIAAAAHYTAGSLGLGVVGTNVQYRPDAASSFHSTATFNTAGTYAAWQTATPWLLSAGVSYTRENQANGVLDPANYRQLSLEQVYAFSKRTVIYLLEARQTAHGTTLGADGTPVAAVAVVGDSQTGTPSSNGQQNVFMAGLRHSF